MISEKFSDSLKIFIIGSFWAWMICQIKNAVKQSHISSVFDGYLYAKNQNDPPVPSWDISDRKVLGSGWLLAFWTKKWEKEYSQLVYRA